MPSLANRGWEESSPGANDGIGSALQIQLKRARLRVEILKEESDPLIKYELFQRLNTGGINLSQQEVRNSVGYMVNSNFQNWLIERAETDFFKNAVDQTEVAIERQAHVELALRYFSFRLIPYDQGLDVHEYLDSALLQLAQGVSFNPDQEKDVFNRTFRLLNSTMGGTAFKRWGGDSFTGKFLMSAFEVVAVGVSRSIEEIECLATEDDRRSFIVERCKALWKNPDFQKHSGAGVRGTTRLANLLPLAQSYFRP